MSNTITLPTTGSCIDIGANAGLFCLPKAEACFTENNLVKDCADRWNCNLCKRDVEYHIPFIRGDKIQFQTQFVDTHNPDRENPAQGFGTGWITVTLKGDVSDTTNLNNFASAWMVAWSGQVSYQTIEIDTSKFTDVCFYLEISDGTNTYCTEEFREVLECDSEYFITIGSTGSDYDCAGNYYGLPADGTTSHGNGTISYDNTIRLEATFRVTGGSIAKTRFASKITDTAIKKNYTLALGAMIPPFMHELLTWLWLYRVTILI